MKDGVLPLKDGVGFAVDSNAADAAEEEEEELTSFLEYSKNLMIQIHPFSYSGLDRPLMLLATLNIDGTNLKKCPQTMLY